MSEAQQQAALRLMHRLQTVLRRADAPLNARARVLGPQQRDGDGDEDDPVEATAIVDPDDLALMDGAAGHRRRCRRACGPAFFAGVCGCR
jgi:hypothetical protein